MKLHYSKKKQIGINLTALIDIMFLLVIFFAVTQSLQDLRSPELQLPSGKHSKEYSKGQILVITVKEPGFFEIEGQNMSKDELTLLLSSGQYPKKNPVLLKLDRRLLHGQVMEILDLLQDNAYKKLSFGTVLPKP